MMKQNQTAKVSSSLILLGVLKGYIKHPLWFLMRSKIAFKTYKKQVQIELPNDFIDTAGFIACIYTRLRSKIGQEKAFEIIRASVLTSGLAVQQASFKNVEEKRTLKHLIKYQQKTNREGTTRLNTMEVIEASEHRYEFRITRCLFHELFTHLKVPELTSIFCSIDNAIFNTYLPEELTFHRNGLNNTFVQGNKYCEFVIENNKVKNTH